MDLSSIDINAARIITCEIEGIVDEDDLRALALGTVVEDAESGASLALVEEVDDPADLKRIREKHHSVARLIAKGLTQNLVASITGYTPSYLSILLNNPSMQELVAHYRIQQGAAIEVITEKLKTVGLKAVEQLEDKLKEGKMNSQDLIGVAKLGLDRSGLGPSSTQRNINENHTFDHAAIAEQMRRAREGSREFIVPVAEVRAALQPVIEHKKDQEDESITPVAPDGSSEVRGECEREEPEHGS